MIPNSKLTKEQKEARKMHKATIVAHGGAIVTSSDGSVTIAFTPEPQNSHILTIGVSIASPYERKIRAKVGEYHALYNLMFGNAIKVPDGVDMYALADVIADH